MGTVYILRSGEADLFKVGWTDGGVEDRIKCLSTGNPHLLSLFDRIETDNASDCEAHLKQILRSKKCHEGGGDEFFSIDPLLLSKRIQEVRVLYADLDEARKLVSPLEAIDSNGNTVAPTQSNMETYSRLIEIREKQTTLDKERELLECKLKLSIGAADELEGLVTWKSEVREVFDRERFQRENPGALERYRRTYTCRSFRLS